MLKQKVCFQIGYILGFAIAALSFNQSFKALLDYIKFGKIRLIGIANAYQQIEAIKIRTLTIVLKLTDCPFSSVQFFVRLFKFINITQQKQVSTSSSESLPNSFPATKIRLGGASFLISLAQVIERIEILWGRGFLASRLLA